MKTNTTSRAILTILISSVMLMSLFSCSKKEERAKTPVNEMPAKTVSSASPHSYSGGSFQTAPSRTLFMIY